MVMDGKAATTVHSFCYYNNRLDKWLKNQNVLWVTDLHLANFIKEMPITTQRSAITALKYRLNFQKSKLRLPDYPRQPKKPLDYPVYNAESIAW